MQEYEVIFYDKADGTEPAKDFILSLDKKMRAKMLRTISLLADNGSDLREPCSKAMGDGIFELRVTDEWSLPMDLSRKHRRHRLLNLSGRSDIAPIISAERRTDHE